MDDDEQRTPSDKGDDPHLLLRVLRTSVTEADVEVGVSLLVSGSWISGTLTSLRRYTDGITASFERAAGQGAEAFAEGWATAMEPAIGRMLDEPFTDPTALYLRDARIWMPDGNVVEGGLVSIRVSAVDAFQLGAIEPSS